MKQDEWICKNIKILKHCAFKVFLCSMGLADKMFIDLVWQKKKEN